MSLNGTVWTAIGPSPITEAGKQDNGMVTSVAVNPYNPNIIYRGTVNGGVWRSRDAGLTWTPLFDRQLALGVGEPGALAIDPANTDVIYLGSSERTLYQNTGIFGRPDSSQGLFKSTDGGDSWIQVGSGFPAGNDGNASQFVGQWINVIIIDPANSNNLYLSSSSGVYFSTNGGQNWTAGSNASGDARSLVLDTSSPAGSRILYTGIVGIGAFRSSDGGQTWKQILSGSTPAVKSAIGPPPQGFGKVIIAIPPATSPPNPAGVQVLYVTMQGTGGANDPVGVFISKDQGGTWTQQAASSMPTRSQNGYSFHMAVDPASPGDGVNDIIYFGTVSQAKSIDSGNSFSSIPVIHADTHCWAFVPQTSPALSIVYCGNDGGLDVSDGGTTWSSLNSGGVQTGLFFNIDIKPDASASVVVGSAQDNGLQTTAGVVSPNWNSPGGQSDGYDIAYDGVTPGTVYGTSGYWSPAPCTRVRVSTVDGTDFPATDITPWGTTSDPACGVFPVATDPSNAGHLYVSGNQNLWQTRNGGGTWRILSAFAATGDVNVAPANGNNVVIAVNNQVFVTTNALASSGVTFTNITRNLPGRNVARAIFDPVDPTVIYAVLGGFSSGGQPGHIFRTTIGGSSWTDLTPLVGTPPQELDLPFNAIALDGTTVPTAIYAGTDFGVLRSIDTGVSWTVLDDIHFPRVPVLDLALNQRAGVLCAATYGRGVFKFVTPTGPAIAINLEDDLDFGVVCSGPVYLNIDVYNVGAADLVISSVQRLMGSSDFTVLPNPSTPLVIAPGDEVTFTVEYTPVAPVGTETAIIRISSNDPGAPFVDVAATGSEGTGAVAAVIAPAGFFGNVCLGSFRDELLTINNTGPCPLSIFNITSTSAAFGTPEVMFYPLIVSPGGSIEVVVRFEPTAFGFAAGTFSILSSDPASPAIVPVTGDAPSPKLALIIADGGDFGKCCVGSFVDEPLILNNSGPCMLSITSIVSSSADFVVPEVLAFPITIAAGASLPIPIRFAPSSFGSKSGTITITSNDPSSPAIINVSGAVPSGTLAVTGSTIFGGVECGCRPQKSVYICNVGECPLHVTSVHLKHKHRHFRLINNPFPATLRPGSSLEVVIQYRATEKYPKACELVITCDDPVTPVKCLDVLAYTLWQHFCCDCCDPCRKDCCEECRKGRCHKCERCGGGRHYHEHEGKEEDDEE